MTPWDAWSGYVTVHDSPDPRADMHSDIPLLTHFFEIGSSHRLLLDSYLAEHSIEWYTSIRHPNHEDSDSAEVIDAGPFASLFILF